jgi:hypothetical protein
VQDDIPTCLRTLGTHLAKIQSFSIDSTDYNFVINLIRESQYFIEWTAPEMDIDNSYNGLYPAEFST